MSRTFIASPILRLETLPKATFRKNPDEAAFLNAYFAIVARWVPIDDALVEAAIEIGARYDVVNLDALHVAAAIRGHADEFVTTERPGKPLYRLSEVGVVHLLDL